VKHIAPCHLGHAIPSLSNFDSEPIYRNCELIKGS
jgi:hypothetical protein